jgi:hypothetical protein
MKRVSAWCLISCVCVGVYASLFWSSRHDDVYSASPRLANFYLRWELSDAEATQLAKWDVVVLDMEVQQRSLAQMKKMRQINPDIILLAYITPQEIKTDLSGGVFRKELASGIKSSWYLTNSGGSQLSWWPGTALLNVTDSVGWRSYLVDFVVKKFSDSGVWDGVFYDNAWDGITYHAGSDVDLNRDGKKDTTAIADGAWRAGMVALYNETKARVPKDFVIVGNGSTALYAGTLNGQMMENFVGGDAWTPTMKTYALWDQKHKDPQVNIVNANTLNKGGGETAYKQMRFGLGSTLLLDGYYSFDYGDTNHGQTWWYDEYDVDLGDPTGNATSPTGQKTFASGVWQREFTQGIALVNSGKQSSKVTLPGEYEKIRGMQDKAVNDGSIVSSVTVPAQDGLLLLRTIQKLDGIIYTNGDFARFFKKSGDRVRNGFFLYDSIAPGGAQVGRIDIDGDDKLDSVVVTRNRITIRRNNGKLLARFRPYGLSFSSGIRIAFGDIDSDGKKEMIVASGAKNLPVRIYDYTGSKIGEDWYPFGKAYVDGYSVALSQESEDEYVVFGSSKGTISVFDPQTRKQVGSSWKAFTANSVPYVAMGNIDTSVEEEIVVGAGKGGGANVKVFSISGKVQSEFVAYSTIVSPGLPVQLADVDTNGVLDIVTLSSGF